MVKSYLTNNKNGDTYHKQGDQGNLHKDDSRAGAENKTWHSSEHQAVNSKDTERGQRAKGFCL